MNGKTPGANVALLLPWWVHAISAALLILVILAARWSWRRREANRTMPRYRFDEHGRILGRDEPPASHALCTRNLCYSPQAGPCTWRPRRRTPSWW